MILKKNLIFLLLISSLIIYSVENKSILNCDLFFIESEDGLIEIIQENHVREGDDHFEACLQYLSIIDKYKEKNDDYYSVTRNKRASYRRKPPRKFSFKYNI